MPNLELTIPAPDESQLRKTADGWLELASKVTVTTLTEYEDALTAYQEIGSELKRLDKMEKDLSRPAYDLHKKIIDFFREPKQFLKSAQTTVKRQLTTWEQEQERIRRAELAKAQERARKERERLEAQAAKAAEKGRMEQAEAKQRLADEVTAAPPPAPEMPKRKGARTTYQAEVTDKMALITAVANGLVPIEALKVNHTVLNQMARAMKKNLDYPGVVVREVRV